MYDQETLQTIFNATAMWATEGDVPRQYTRLLDIISFHVIDDDVRTFISDLLTFAAVNNLDTTCLGHPQFNVAGTRTGRMSCTKPNLSAMNKQQRGSDGTDTSDSVCDRET